MRLFNAKIIDRRLEGDSVAMASEAWACLLARAESLKFVCFVDQVINSPVLHLELFGSAIDADLIQSFIGFEIVKSLKVLSDGTVTGATTITAAYSQTDGAWPPPKHLFVEATLTGATGTAHIEVWVCGRGPQLLEAAPATSTFAAQLAAARACEDENRLPSCKRVLRQGASLFYPPELFEPSLKWDR